MIKNDAYNSQNTWSPFRSSKQLPRKLVWLFAVMTTCSASQRKVETKFVHQIEVPMVNVREFMTTQHDYIWTMNGTLKDECVMCKVEKVEENKPESVTFWRNYTFDRLTVSKLLRGDYYGRAGQPPNIMNITVLREEFVINNNTMWPRLSHVYSYMEILLYAEKNLSCGVFLHKAKKYMTKPTDDLDYYKEDYKSCEVRQKARMGKWPSSPSKNCMGYFRKHCQQPFFPVFRSFCKMP